MIVYIMGRPHSGSTILNMLLGNSKFIESVGQFVSGIANPRTQCSCGQLIANDPFWQEIRAQVEASGVAWDQLVNDSVKQAHLAWFWRTLIATPNNQFFCRLSSYTSALEAAIQNTRSKLILCDSSKEVSRALFLVKFHPTAHIIFLVRDPRACVYSHYWRFKREGRFHFLRRNYYFPSWALFPIAMVSALSWSVGNLMSEVTAAFCRQKVLRVRYEDLSDHPEDSIKLIGEFLGLSVGDLVTKQSAESPLEVGHNIGGNRIRTHAQRLVVSREERRGQNLPVFMEFLVLGVCWPLMLRYGYPVARNG